MLNQILPKKNYTDAKYFKMSEWANANNAEIVDTGDAYEIKPILLKQPSDDEIQTMLTAAVQRWMDKTVQQRNYDNVHTCVGTYLTSPVSKFRNEAVAVRDWVSHVWEHCYAVLNEVKTGKRAVPTEQELIAELPKLKW